MEDNQKINCTVGTCKYNNTKNNLCNLKSIKVCQMQDIKTMKADESMCSSYKCELNK